MCVDATVTRRSFLTSITTDDSLREILFPYNASPTQEEAPDTAKTSDKHRRAPSVDPPIISPIDLVPLETKRELVLGAVDDMKDAEKVLREIQLLIERGVEGSGDLAGMYRLFCKRVQANEWRQCTSRCRNALMHCKRRTPNDSHLSRNCRKR